MEDDNTKLLQTYKLDLEMYNTQLKQQVQECKIALQRGSDIQIFDQECQSSIMVPVKSKLGTTSFTPNQNPRALLQQAFGKVNVSGQGHYQSDGSSAGQRLSSIQDQSKEDLKISSKQQRPKGKKEVTSPVYTLLSDTKELEKWRSPCSITALCPITDDQVWSSYFNSVNLTLLDGKRKVKQEVTHKTEIIDISLSSTTNTLWVCDYDNNILELVSGRLVHRFSTKELPQCICITTSNHVIVGMDGQISKFTTKGKLVLSTSGTGKTIVCKPYRISECPVTHNVVVADWGSQYDGKRKPQVAVMDRYFKELFVYGGEIPDTYQPTPQSGGKPFHPRSVVYDSVGNLVIGDSNNSCILLISGRGDFLRIIHKDKEYTKTVGIDREDVLWAVFQDDNVKLLQYSCV